MRQAKFRAELRCYHCGSTAASVEGESGRPLSEAQLFEPTLGSSVREHPMAPLRCGRCRGPLFLDEVESIRYEPMVFEPEPAARRGRPSRMLDAL
jgi:hypothetical protein